MNRKKDLNMTIPSRVLTEYKLSTEQIKISWFTHPWHHSNVCRATTNEKDIVLKKWTKKELERLHNEQQFLSHLQKNHFNSFAFPIKTIFNKAYCIDDEGIIWSAYSYLPVIKKIGMKESHGRKIGLLLGNFHRVSSKWTAKKNYPSRLSRIPELLHDFKIGRFGYEPVVLHQLILFFEREIIPRLSLLQSLPKTMIHGDMNADNILITCEGFKLIDFEFARIDLRLFDIVSLLAPFRSDDGEFVLATSSFFQSIIRTYQQYHHLNQLEIDALPLIAIVHFSFILSDLHMSESSFVDKPLNILRALLNNDTYKEYSISNGI